MLLDRSHTCFAKKAYLGKIKFRALPKHVGPQILSLESVDYFGTSEQHCVVEQKIRIVISKTVMVTGVDPGFYMSDLHQLN